MNSPKHHRPPRIPEGSMRTITLEEHFAPAGFLDGPGRQLKDNLLKAGARGAKIVEQLGEVGEQRLADMDAAGIDMQVLSLNAPGTEQLAAADAVPLAREANEFLAEAVKKHPTRFAGLAALPTAVPDKAALELERTVREHGFRGALINGHVRGRYLDDQFFWPIFERRRGARRADLHAPDAAAGGGRRGAVWRLFAASELRAVDLGLGLAHRNRRSRHPPHSRRRVRPLSEAADRDRSPRRGTAVHAAAARPQPGAGE